MPAGEGGRLFDGGMDEAVDGRARWPQRAAEGQGRATRPAGVCRDDGQPA